MSESEATKYAKYLATEAKRMRILVEIDLHRLEESALNTLKQHGLKVNRSKRYVSIASSGPSGKGGYGVGGTNDPRFIFRNILERAKQTVVRDKKRLCHFTYNFDQCYEVANKVLANKKAAHADIVAAVVALKIEELWVNLTLMNAQSMWFVLDFARIIAMVPSEKMQEHIISETRKHARKEQNRPLIALAEYVKTSAKEYYEDDKNETVQSIAKILFADNDSVKPKFGVKSKLGEEWYREQVRKVLPASANKTGRPRTRTQ